MSIRREVRRRPPVLLLDFSPHIRYKVRGGDVVQCGGRGRGGMSLGIGVRKVGCPRTLASFSPTKGHAPHVRFSALFSVQL